jgi:hypothetical protein
LALNFLCSLFFPSGVIFGKEVSLRIMFRFFSAARWALGCCCSSQSV